MKLSKMSFMSGMVSSMERIDEFVMTSDRSSALVKYVKELKIT